MKVCACCSTAKGLDQFSVRKASRDGLNRRCKECDRKAQKVQYANNTAYYLDRNRELRSENRRRYNMLKADRPCAHCKGYFHAVCMDFDHIDPKTKTLCVAQMLGYSWVVIEKEIAKCELLCANCHRLKTYQTGTRHKQHEITTIKKRGNIGVTL